MTSRAAWLAALPLSLLVSACAAELLVSHDPPTRPPCDACSADEACVARRCVPRDCPSQRCAQDHVCVQGRCAPQACLDPERAAPDGRGSLPSCQAPGCLIEGQAYAPEAPHPDTPCLSCQPALSASTWSPLPAPTICRQAAHPCDEPERCQDDGSCAPDILATPGASCGPGLICHQGGSCAAGCWIDGQGVADDQPHPQDPCQRCSPALATDRWSQAPEASPCGQGLTCHQGRCTIAPEQVDLIGFGAQRPDVMSWPAQVTLRSMNIHWGAHFGPPSWYFRIDADGYTAWPSYKPYGGQEDTPVIGNIWIFVRQPDSSRWWATPIEGLVDFTPIHPAGNLNFDHTNILASTPLASPWQPEPGQLYGWMLSGNVMFPGNNIQARTTITLEAWPRP